MYLTKWLVPASSIATIAGFPAISLAQSPAEVELPPDASDRLERTIPRSNESLPDRTPRSLPEPNIRTPATSSFNCPASTEKNFYIRDIRVVGNTVLSEEIAETIQPFKRHRLSFEDLICLRSQITQLYLDNNYVTSGAFLPNNQKLSNGIVQIQIVEGELEKIEIDGLDRLQESYVRSRLRLAADTPLNRQSLEAALQLLILDPLIDRVNAELTAGSSAGSNILLLNVSEAPAFNGGLFVDNYRSPSIGEIQGSVSVVHNNLFGFGDRFNAGYGFTEGLDLYNTSYTIPWNALNGTVGLSYDNSDSGIIEEEFRELDIESETETFAFNLRQPLVKSPNSEFAVGLSLDLRRRQTFLQGEPFSFSEGLEDGESKVTVLRLSQDWVNRQTNSVIAARSQFNFGIDAFDATINDTETDGKFFAWQGQFQWVRQLSSRTLLVARIGSQLSTDSLLSLEKFSLGGVNTVRGYRENELIVDNGLLGSIEFRVPLTEDPSVFQIVPFAEIGTGWNNIEPDPDPATIASLGLGLRWSIGAGFNLGLDYGIPLISVDEGSSIQENGLHFAFSYQPF